MKSGESDRIVKRIELRANPSRVWRALTDYREFGAWFQVELDGPFVPGRVTRGRVTYPGYEHLVMEVTVHQMEPERRFSYYWHPANIDPKTDYSEEPQTLVEFTLEPTAAGTLLTVVESGFDALPAERRAEAFRMNTEGWTEQLANIAKYLSARA